MLTKTELSKYADVLIWGLQVARSSAGGKYKRGDVIYLPYDLESISLAEILHERLLKKGFHIVMRLRNTPKILIFSILPMKTS